MSQRRSGDIGVLDVSEILKYENRLDVYASFTDNGFYDFEADIDKNIRPFGILAYPVNDIIGRISRETTLYARVFRYRTANDQKKSVDINQYTREDYNKDVQSIIEFYPDLAEDIEVEVALIPGKMQIDTPFARLWLLTYTVARMVSSGRQDIQKNWTNALLFLGYQSIQDRQGRGIITRQRRKVILVLGQRQANDVEDLEIVSTQEFKKEKNSAVNVFVRRFNASTKVSNARNRIAKW